MLTGKQFVPVRILQLAHDLVLLARLVAVASQKNEVAIREFGGVGTFQSAGHEVGIGHELGADETATVQVSMGWGLDQLNRNPSRSNQRALRGSLVCRSRIGLLSSCCYRQAQYEQQSCFLHVTSEVETGCP